MQYLSVGVLETMDESSVDCMKNQMCLTKCSHEKKKLLLFLYFFCCLVVNFVNYLIGLIIIIVMTVRSFVS